MNAPSAREKDAALALLLLDAPGYGPRKVLDLLLSSGSATAAYRHVVAEGSKSDKLRDHMSQADPDSYLEVLAATHAAGGDFKLWTDQDYPANLTKWAARPPVLFFKGSLDRLSSRALALVGRVDPTDRGVDAATRFGRMCVDNEIQIISGLAKGIDGASHRAALQEPAGTTFAVLGHGIDYSYPAENRDLYEQIPRNGAVISQFATGMAPQRWTFPARNEAMCTLALGTVIIEGKEGCGSIIQADFSFKHGRPVFLLSRNLKTDDTAWAEKLVKRGAHVIEYFEQAAEIVEKTTGELWGEKLKQGTFFGVTPTGTVTEENDMSGEIPTRVALFDIDGVVVDSRAAHTAALAEIASRHLGRRVQPSDVVATGAAHKALEALGVPAPYNVYKAEYDTAFSAHASKIEVFEDMVQALKDLKRTGVALGAITSQPRRRARIMLPLEVRDLFDVFLDWNDTRGKKEEGIAVALRRLGGSRDATFFAGDQTTDLDAARKAGVPSVAVLWGFSGEAELRRWSPDLLLTDPVTASEQLIELLNQGVS